MNTSKQTQAQTKKQATKVQMKEASMQTHTPPRCRQASKETTNTTHKQTINQLQSNKQALENLIYPANPAN
jgi:hypothetical protein